MIWPRLLPRLDLALLLAMATAWAISHRQGLDVAAIEAAVGDMGAWAPLAYISLFALAAVLFVPGSILSLAGGGLFGPVWGKAYALLGATVGATLAFLAALPRIGLGCGNSRRPAEAARRGRRGGGQALHCLCPPGSALPFQSGQLCARPHARQATRLFSCFAGLHGTRRDRLHLPRLCRPRSGRGRGRPGAEGPDGAWPGRTPSIFSAGGSAVAFLFFHLARRRTVARADRQRRRAHDHRRARARRVQRRTRSSGGAKTSRSPSFLGASATSINSRSKRWCSAAERRRARQGRRSRSSRRVSATSPCCVAEWRNGAASGSRSRKKRVSPSKGCLDLNGRRSFKRSANAPMRLYVR